jgi:UPF0755 protein
MRVVVRVLVVLVVLGVGVLAGAWIWLDRAANTPLDPDGKSKPAEFTVQKGRTLNQLGPELVAAKLIESPFVFKLYVKLHRPAPPKAGRHALHPGMTIPELIGVLSSNPLPDDVPLTMVEGWRLVDADAELARRGFIEAGQYLRAAQESSRFTIKFPFDATTAKNLEGYLFPETYAVPAGKIDVDKLIQRQLDAFHERFYQPNRAEISEHGRSLHELVIVASMLEREEPDPPTRPKVAGVIYRRLELNIALGIDATSRYMLADWNDRRTFLANLRDPNEAYNTRFRAGLPPGPIGSASLPSLLSALRPEKSPYLYYLHDAQRRIHFARTAAEHEANRKKYNVY